MKDLSILFFAGYLLSALFLLPLTILYLSLGIKKTPIPTIHRLHKALVLLSVVLPLGMVLVSYGNSTNSQDMNRGTTFPGSDISEPAATRQQATVPDILPRSLPSPHRLPGLVDTAFYVVDLVGLFSILGMSVFVLRYALQVWRLNRLSRNAMVSIIDTGIRLVESNRIHTPFSVGCFRKSIFIPKNMSASEKRIVIRHELNHFHCHHHPWSLLEALLVSAFWFNPVNHLLHGRGTLLREIECDSRTVLDIDRYEYTRTLLKTAESMAIAWGKNRFPLLTHGWIRKGDLKRRIERLMATENGKKKTAIGALVAVAVIVTLIGGLFYGNLDDTVQQEILSGIDREYNSRAPFPERVDIEKVPEHFVNALLLHEDRHFFEHRGINFKSILRATGVNIKALLSGRSPYQDGGSTITQQLAKQFINNPQKTLKRKLKELKTTRVLEMNFSKDEILEMYLNMVYFGNGAFGLKTASETYFGHVYDSLTVSESAMLVPFLTAPSKYNVIEDPVVARKRQAALLEKIKSTGNKS